MKKITVTLLAVFFLAISTIANDAKLQILNASQVSKLDLNGKWSGKRNQYTTDRKAFIETFEYEFDLKQEGNIVTGTSTIISSNGEYADMKLEGTLVGNKLHFAETEVKGAARPDGKVWCFKSGELFFAKDGDNIRLVGATPSYMEIYNLPCSGGETDLVKVDNSSNLSLLDALPKSNVSVADEKFAITVFPNPFVENATIYYSLDKDSKVRVEIFDISGKSVSNLFDGNQKQGNYSLNFSAKNAGFLSGIYIVKMTVNGEVYSRQLVQMR